ncbi:MAG TPA: flagellar hook-basal body complex protein FliE [Alphaproteobacteria bacterium]
MTVNIAGAVAAYRNAASKLLGPGLPPRDAAAPDRFSSLIKDGIASTADVMAKGEALSTAAVTGGKADLTSVITAVTNAELTLQTVVAVRDKVIQAYQDIMRMPI